MKNKIVKGMFDRKVKAKYEGDYEQKRWFSSPLARAGYEMILQSLNYHLLAKDLSFQDYLELGPGPGTWTKFFLIKNPQARFDLIDISEEMLKLAKDNLRDYKNVRFFEKDFLRLESDKKYDFFFSCRAIEYISNKNKAVSKMDELLKIRGTGFVITKMPKYLRAKILGRKIPALHRGQVSPKKLKKLLKKHGFHDIEVYPITTSFPLLHSAKINKLLHKIFFRHRLNFLSQFFAESYCIKFKKL